MRLEPLFALFCGLVGAFLGIGAAAWYWLGVPRKTGENLLLTYTDIQNEVYQ